MQIEIQDPGLAARIKRQIEIAGDRSVEETLTRLLQTQEEQDRRLTDQCDAINRKILSGLQQMDQDEGIPGDEALAQLKERKEAWLKQNLAAKD